jgi:hypothetical protein
MLYPCKTVALIAFVALLSAGPAFTQAPPTEEASKPAGSAATEAYVYVQTHQGVNVYDATAAGKLTLVKGSPFATTGQMGGTNGKYLISVGTDLLRSYAIELDGAVGRQMAEINTQDYGGSECGNNTGGGSFLDHTGKYFYTQLFGRYTSSEPNACKAWQTYQIEPNGSLEFLGDVDDTDTGNGYGFPTSILTISSSDKFEYGIDPYVPNNTGECGTDFSPFIATPTGVIEENSSFTATYTGDNPYNLGVLPLFVQADPHGHLAALVTVCDNSGNAGQPQLESYSIDTSTGGISSHNTWDKMPTATVGGYLYGESVSTMNMSPSGLLVAVAGHPGLQIFHFNGAEIPTDYSNLLLPSVNLDQLAWDKDNHLYALSYESNQLYVFTVTPTTISEAPGSPYSIQNAYGIQGLVVVPKL